MLEIITFALFILCLEDCMYDGLLLPTAPLVQSHIFHFSFLTLGYIVLTFLP